MALEPYDEFVRRHVALTEEEFLDAVTVPHLLVERYSDEESTTTIVTRRVGSSLAQEQGAEPVGREIVALAKAGGGSNPFSMMITLGRAPNNDVVLTLPSISQFHLYFTRGGNDRWNVTDANSSNGTLLNAVLLQANTHAPLETGDELLLSRAVRLTFLKPTDLLRRLRSDAQRANA